MLDATRHDDKLARSQHNDLVPKLDAELARQTRNISSTSSWWCHGKVPCTLTSLTSWPFSSATIFGRHCSAKQVNFSAMLMRSIFPSLRQIQQTPPAAFFHEFRRELAPHLRPHDHHSVARSGLRHHRPVLAQQPIDALRPTSVGQKTVCMKKAPADLNTCRRSQNCCRLIRIFPRITLFGRHTWPGSSCSRGSLRSQLGRWPEIY
jgi:hypothetical protein